ncbi:hypothetical protein A3SI_07639 [Nitritalea halalkaliphila LW7]|uniref:Uncharacterized protein n=1 Tax=Nitritalea halalkaliphila LW7 TaxID=1189621 RepID=I5C5P5_9BACT|nr:hypothetical protein [Nitritalea halalkaliphila]EIM77147.1 hypothetical protein A3SI_07639 [Nitritalea halalkaliphila LW7]
MNEELKKQAEALEQTLRMQLSVAKNEQGDILKLGAAVLGGGILAFSLVRLFKGKKKKKNAAGHGNPRARGPLGRRHPQPPTQFPITRAAPARRHAPASYSDKKKAGSAF